MKVAAILVAAVLAIALFEAWRADRRDRDHLEAELAASKQVLAAADTRQHDRDGQLVQTLASLAAEKRSVTTPAQILRQLPQAIPLPTPLTLQPEPADLSSLNPSIGPSKANRDGESFATQHPGKNGPGGADGQAKEPQQPNVLIPTEDLKPLYDFALDCKACQAKLATTWADLTDEKTKTAALTRERNDALRVARGGSLLRRIARAAKWFAIGAAAGAIAAKAVH